MNFIRNLEELVINGKISSKEALELKMHYYSLNIEEKKEIDSKHTEDNHDIISHELNHNIKNSINKKATDRKNVSNNVFETHKKV